MKKNIVSLHGSYFFNNYGDILLVNLFASWICQACTNVEINLPMANRAKINELPGEKNGLLNLLKSKALVFCGGGYFGEQPRHKLYWSLRNFYRHGIVGALAIFFRIPYVIIGVEFGPISYSWFRRVVIWIAKNAKLVIVRNQESYDFLQKYGVKDVRLSYDAVLSLSKTIKPAVTDDSNPSILLHIPSYYLYKEQIRNLVECVIDTIKSSQWNSCKLYLVSDDPYKPYDSEDCNTLISLLNKSGISYSIPDYTTYESLIQLINESSYIFTTKLHVGITAAALNKRVFSLYAHPKTARLHKQINNERFCMPITSNVLEVKDRIKDFFSSDPYNIPLECVELSDYNRRAVCEFITSIIK